jgi:hypothetical protein
VVREDGAVTVVEREFACKSAIVRPFGRSLAADRIASSKLLHEKNDAAAVFEFGDAVNHTIANSAPALAPIWKWAGPTIEVIAIPSWPRR